MHNKDHPSKVNAGDTTVGRSSPITIGGFIAIGAGLGIVVGLLLDDLVLGMLYGAGLGTVVGAVRETLPRPVDGEIP